MGVLERLALGELLALARLVQADLLAFDFSRVARDQSGLRQRGDLGVARARARDPLAPRGRRLVGRPAVGLDDRDHRAEEAVRLVGERLLQQHRLKS